MQMQILKKKSLFVLDLVARKLLGMFTTIWVYKSSFNCKGMQTQREMSSAKTSHAFSR